MRQAQNNELSTIKKEWGAMLDSLCGFATAEEEAKIRERASNVGRPTHLVPLHDYVAGLLVKYGIITWHLMQTRFTCELSQIYFWSLTTDTSWWRLRIDVIVLVEYGNDFWYLRQAFPQCSQASLSSGLKSLVYAWQVFARHGWSVLLQVGALKVCVLGVQYCYILSLSVATCLQVGGTRGGGQWQFWH